MPGHAHRPRAGPGSPGQWRGGLSQRGPQLCCLGQVALALHLFLCPAAHASRGGGGLMHVTRANQATQRSPNSSVVLATSLPAIFHKSHLQVSHAAPTLTHAAADSSRCPDPQPRPGHSPPLSLTPAPPLPPEEPCPIHVHINVLRYPCSPQITVPVQYQTPLFV